MLYQYMKFQYPFLCLFFSIITGAKWPPKITFKFVGKHI